VFTDPQQIKLYLTNPVIDYDKVVDEEAKKQVNVLEGMIIVSFDKLGEIDIG